MPGKEGRKESFLPIKRILRAAELRSVLNCQAYIDLQAICWNGCRLLLHTQESLFAGLLIILPSWVLGSRVLSKCFAALNGDYLFPSLPFLSLATFIECHLTRSGGVSVS